MSRLDSKVAEANRVAFLAATEKKAHEAAVVTWLAEFPEVGSLSSGKFYIYPVGGEYQEVAALSNPNL
tara:strand:- start:828 stop:1031 length:204 start_codon:yes stop_codon:yes gene_type:complete